MLSELEERAGHGEFVPASAKLSIHVGRRDLPAIRTAFGPVLEEATPTLGLATVSGFLAEFRSDPEIDRMLRELYRE